MIALAWLYLLIGSTLMLARIPTIAEIRGGTMADFAVPHYCNDAGVRRIRIGVSEFQCMGASPPHDHPHIYLDMGSDSEIICPYCSTVYERDTSLSPEQSDPPGCRASGNS